MRNNNNSCLTVKKRCRSKRQRWMREKQRSWRGKKRSLAYPTIVPIEKANYKESYLTLSRRLPSWSVNGKSSRKPKVPCPNNDAHSWTWKSLWKTERHRLRYSKAQVPKEMRTYVGVKMRSMMILQL